MSGGLGVLFMSELVFMGVVMVLVGVVVVAMGMAMVIVNFKGHGQVMVIHDEKGIV